MDSSWFTNMFEITEVDLAGGNMSFEDPQMPGFPKGVSVVFVFICSLAIGL
jgi:hypothetical protein